MKKSFVFGLAILLSAILFTGCLSSPPAPYTPPADTSGTETTTGSETTTTESTGTDTAAGGESDTSVDATTSASPKESGDPADLVNGLSASGYWIFSILNDVSLSEALSVDGDFHNGDDPADRVYRKLALYAQDENRNVTANYTLTVPQMAVTSTNFRIQGGTVKGDIMVDAMGFELVNTTIEGNVTFKTREQMDSAKLGGGKISGTVFVGEADAVTAASPKESTSPVALVNGLSTSGYWIFSVLSDVTVDTEFTVAGEFHSRDDASADIYRKLALYAQDADRNVTANYTLTVPQMTVESPNFRIQNGTVKGDIVVNADGFELYGCTVEGNLTFETQEQMDSAKLESGTVTGTVSVR